MATTQDWQLALQNDSSKTEKPRIDFYHYTPRGGLNAIGSPDREAPTEYPVAFLGAMGHHLLIGSESRVWVYDGRVGGIHPWLDLTDASSGVFKGAVPVLDSSGNQQLLIKEDATASVMNMITADPTTVTDFGDDLTTYVVTSNYFNFNRPFEKKTILSFDVQTEKMTASQRFTIYLQIDDGDWLRVGYHEGAKSFTSVDVSEHNHVGRRFRYKVVYETKTAASYGFMGIEFQAAAGEMVPLWQMVLSGRGIRNVDNEVVDAETARENLEASAANQESIAMIDGYKSNPLLAEQRRVLVREVGIIKESAGEAIFSLEVVGF